MIGYIHEAYELLERRDNKSLKEATVNFAIQLGFDREYPWLHDNLETIQVHHLDGNADNHNLSNLGLIPDKAHYKLHGHLNNKENRDKKSSDNTKYNNWFLKKDKLLLTLTDLMLKLTEEI